MRAEIYFPSTFVQPIDKQPFSDISSQELFTRVDNMSAVTKQPACKEERLNALQVP